MSSNLAPEFDDIEIVDARRRLLIADDSTLCRRHLRQQLEAASPVALDFTEVADGAGALAELASNRYDMAFIDVTLGDVSGLETLAAAREQGIGTFVVVVSADASAQNLARAQALRAYDFIEKPVDPRRVEHVLACFAEVTQRRTALLIDDSGTALRIMTRVFDRSMFAIDVVTAPDGITGFESFCRRPADMVFVDVNMGALDGLSTARIFRAHKPNVQLVLMSGDDRALAASGLPLTLKKPFGARDIDRLLHRIVGLRTPFGPQG